jgi:hypothetical protein
VEKMRFPLKTLKGKYGFETKCIVQSITTDVRPRARTYGLECDKKLLFLLVISKFLFPFF